MSNDNDKDNKATVDTDDKKIIMSFNDYLKEFLDIRSEEEYGLIVANIKKTEIAKFPDLFKPHLDKTKQDDIETKVIPLHQSNTMYATILKFIACQVRDNKMSIEEQDKIRKRFAIHDKNGKELTTPPSTKKQSPK